MHFTRIFRACKVYTRVKEKPVHTLLRVFFTGEATHVIVCHFHFHWESGNYTLAIACNAVLRVSGTVCYQVTVGLGFSRSEWMKGTKRYNYLW